MSPTAQFPSLLMIIRHGEKPGNPSSDTDGGPDLSIPGSARAAALPSLFTPDVCATAVQGLLQLSCKVAAGDKGEFTGTSGATSIAAGNPIYRVPDFLFAAKKSSQSDRPKETITPLSQVLNLTIDHSFEDADHKALAKAILDAPATYGGKVVLICWHHGTIHNLVEDFGIPKPTTPQLWDPWPGTVFDLVLQITWTGSTPSLKVGYQQLLFGDTPTPAAGH